LYIRGRAEGDTGGNCQPPDLFEVPPHVYAEHQISSTSFGQASSRTYYFNYQLFSSVYGSLGSASVYFVVTQNYGSTCYTPNSNQGPHGYLVSDDVTALTVNGKSVTSPLAIGMIVVGIVGAVLLTAVVYRVRAHWKLQNLKTQSIGGGHSIPVIPEEHRGSISLHRGVVKGTHRPKTTNPRSRVSLPVNPVLTHMSPRSPSFVIEEPAPASNNPSREHSVNQSQSRVMNSQSHGDGYLQTEGLEHDGKELADLAVSIVNGGRKKRRNQHVRVHSREFETPLGPRKIVQSIELETPSGSHHVRVHSRELPSNFLSSPEQQRNRSRNNSNSGPDSPSGNGPSSPSGNRPASPSANGSSASSPSSRAPSPAAEPREKETLPSDMQTALKLVVGEQ